MNIKNKGFTLVELAIVMTIIGLLIGGILKGQQLIKNAQITSMISQVKSYDTAVTIFRDKYGTMPGDMPTASFKLPNCNLANLCENGDSDSIIGVPNEQMWRDIDASIASENTQFWKHLVLSDLISGVNPSAATGEWGGSHPTSKLQGGFFIRFASASNLAFYRGSAHYLTLRNNISGATSIGNSAPLSPAESAIIDRKMDDGLPFTGYVRAVSGGLTRGCNWDVGGRQNWYDETITSKRCELYFMIK